MSQTQPSRWEALTEIARRCVAEKQFDKAEEAFLAALREAEQFGDTDQRVAATLNALARVYHRRSKFFPAAALLHRLLGIKERELGEQHPELAGILTNLAEMYSRLGDSRQELELRERALAIRTNAGEADGGALEGLRSRIDELRQKLEDERAREEAARNAPRPRIPVPTGATDLPLILPTPLASPQLRPLAGAFAPSRKAHAGVAREPLQRAAAVAPVAPRSPSPAPVAAAVQAAAPQTVAAPTPFSLGAPAPLALPAPETPARLSPARSVDVIHEREESLTPAPSAKVDLAPAVPVWQPLAPPAPVTRWPGEHRESEPEPLPEPDESSDVELAFAPRRNWRPFAYGGLAVAAAAVLAVLAFGGPETADSASGALAAQPAVRAPAPAVRTPAPLNAGEAAALEAGLANLQQENAVLPPEPGTGSLDFGTPEGIPASASRAGADQPAEQGRGAESLRVRIPTVAIDNVTKSIEEAARARVDSITEARDKQVYEYSGKKPRQ
jgi:tetratricopeptide (TPR) repeat protein